MLCRIDYSMIYSRASQVVLVAKNPPASAGDIKTWVQSLGQEGTLEEDMATHSSILAWRIPCQRSLAGYSPQDCKESDTTEVTYCSTWFLCWYDSSGLYWQMWQEIMHFICIFIIKEVYCIELILWGVVVKISIFMSFKNKIRDMNFFCFYVLAVVYSASVNTGVHESFQIVVFSRYMPSSGIEE